MNVFFKLKNTYSNNLFSCYNLFTYALNKAKADKLEKSIHQLIPISSHYYARGKFIIAI